MGFAETLIYAADTLESLAYNHIAQTGAVVLAVVFAGSYLAGETGSRLRAGLVRLGVFALIGALGALTMVAVNGVPAPQSAEAPVSRKADRRVEDWIARQQQMAETARDRATRSGPGEARAAEMARLRLLERAEARRGIEREGAEIRRTPESARNAEQRRREADLELRLADIDRIEGRLQVDRCPLLPVRPTAFTGERRRFDRPECGRRRHRHPAASPVEQNQATLGRAEPS